MVFKTCPIHDMPFGLVIKTWCEEYKYEVHIFLVWVFYSYYMLSHRYIISPRSEHVYCALLSDASVSESAWSVSSVLNYEALFWNKPGGIWENHDIFQITNFYQEFWTMYTRVNKNPSAWNFLSPKPEVTCGTVAIIIRVVLLSLYLCICAISLSSIHYNQSHRIYINRGQQ